jgi:arabinose-5-phosphate isomerase
MESVHAVRRGSEQQIDPSVHDQSRVIDAARQVFEQQSLSIARLASRLGSSYCDALQLLGNCSGRLVASGIGKSGLIGRKLAATFSCSGMPSFFLHPTEALHGDLGMVREGDIALVISNSGETQEVITLLPSLRERGVPIIALLGDLNSTIGRRVDIALDVSVEREACPLNLIPTTSTMAALAMGEALALSAMAARDFCAAQFAQLHPGGNLGRRLACRVRDVMRRQQLPFIGPTDSVSHCIVVMTAGRCGLAIVMDERRQLVGIVTDGDLRRALQRNAGALSMQVNDIMTRNPVTITQGASLAEAEERMHRLRIKHLLVLNEDKEVAGLVEIFDG